MSSDAVKEMLKKRGLLVAEAWDDEEEEEQDSPPTASSSKHISSEVDMNAQSGRINESASVDEQVEDNPRELDNAVRTSTEEFASEVARQACAERQVASRGTMNSAATMNSTDFKDLQATGKETKLQGDVQAESNAYERKGEGVEPTAAKPDVKDLLRKRGLLVEEAWDDDVNESQDRSVSQQNNEQLEADSPSRSVMDENKVVASQEDVALRKEEGVEQTAAKPDVKDLLRKRGLLVEEAWDDDENESQDRSVSQQNNEQLEADPPSRSVMDENKVVASQEDVALPERSPRSEGDRLETRQIHQQSSSVEGDWEETPCASPRGDWEEDPRCLQGDIRVDEEKQTHAEGPTQNQIPGIHQTMSEPPQDDVDRSSQDLKVQAEELQPGLTPTNKQEESPRADWEEPPSLQGQIGVDEEKQTRPEGKTQNQSPGRHQNASEPSQDDPDPSRQALNVQVDRPPRGITPVDKQEGPGDPVSTYIRVLNGDLDAFDDFPAAEKAKLKDASAQAVRRASTSNPLKGKKEVRAESIYEHMLENGQVPNTSECREIPKFDDAPLFVLPSEKNYDESEFEEFASEVARQACDERQVASRGTMNSAATMNSSEFNSPVHEEGRQQGTLKFSSSDGLRSLPGKPVAPRTLCRSYGTLPTAEDNGVLKRPIFLNTLSHIRSLPKIKFGEKRPSAFITINENPGPGSYNLADPGRTSKFRERTTPSFGGGASRFGNDKEKVKPAPGQYGIPKNPVQEMQRKVAFSMDARECKRHNYVVRDLDPGPGAYDLPSRFGKGNGVTAKGKLLKIYNAAKAFPGPGAYDPKHDGLSKFASTEKIGVGTSTRTNWAELHCCRTPGPGAYSNEIHGELGRSSTKYSFKVRHRKPSSFDPYVTPGPGSYNAHGTCFGY